MKERTLPETAYFELSFMNIAQRVWAAHVASNQKTFFQVTVRVDVTTGDAPASLIKTKVCMVGVPRYVIYYENLKLIG